METNKLEQLQLCWKAIEWFRQQPDFTTAWQTCERGDWMFDIARRLNINERKLVLANYHVVNQIRNLIKDERSLKTLDTAYEYGTGKIDKDKLFSACQTALSVTFRSIAHTVLAVHAALTDDPAYCSAAIHAAHSLASTANTPEEYIAIKKASLKKAADICRKYLTEEVLDVYNKL